MNSLEAKGPEKKIENKDVKRSEGIEKTEKVPIKVNDLRDLSARSFNLDKFLAVIAKLRMEGLFDISREFKDSDYGKYMSVFASSESDHWDEAIQTATAIEITLTTPPNRGMPGLVGKTNVELRILMGEKEGRIFRFSFNNEGKYSSGGWNDLHLEKRLGEGKSGKDFTLIVDPGLATKKLE